MSDHDYGPSIAANLAANALLPEVPEEFNTKQKLEAWHPQDALNKLRELVVPGISERRLHTIQNLRAMFTKTLNRRN